MALRVFTDPEGRSWQVWNVLPGPQIGFERTVSHLPPEMTEGWLCFESESEKRRLAPIPAGWEERHEGELWMLCSTAVRLDQRPSVAGAA